MHISFLGDMRRGGLHGVGSIFGSITPVCMRLAGANIICKRVLVWEMPFQAAKSLNLDEFAKSFQG